MDMDRLKTLDRNGRAIWLCVGGGRKIRQEKHHVAQNRIRIDVTGGGVGRRPVRKLIGCMLEINSLPRIVRPLERREFFQQVTLPCGKIYALFWRVLFKLKNLGRRATRSASGEYKNQTKNPTATEKNSITARCLL